MTFLPVPPAYVKAFDAPWNHQHHANRCAKMVRGSLIVTLPSPEVPWLVYDSNDTWTSAHRDGRTLVIDGDQKFTGRICYGYGLP